MTPTTLTQMTGQPPVAARRRGPVAGGFRHDAAHRHAPRPYAGIPVMRCAANGSASWVLGSGFWGGSVDVTTRTNKRPTRPLAPRST